MTFGLTIILDVINNQCILPERPLQGEETTYKRGDIFTKIWLKSRVCDDFIVC